jgi:PD-(D/E)XK nuclease superfamily
MVYEECPFQYYSTFVLGLPPPVSRAMRRGGSVHSLIAKHFRQPEFLPPRAEPVVLHLLEHFKQSRFNLPPVAVEQPFTLPFERGDVRGRIDVVLPRPNDGLEVVDFKSGSSREREEMDARLQLPLYAMAVGGRYQKRPEELAYTYYFLADNGEVSFSPTSESFEMLGTRVDSVMRAIEDERFEPAAGCRCFACRRPLTPSPFPSRGEGRRGRRTFP